MNLRHSSRLKARLKKLPEGIQQKFLKQVYLLQQNLTHPSLRAKKYDESADVWQARVDRKYRFYFRIEGDTYTLLDIVAHLD